jgi:hypothetical protein
MKKFGNSGVLLTLSYIGMSGTANVMLASYLSQYDPFCITAICFLATTTYFTLLHKRRLPKVYQLCQAHRHDFMLINVYAVANWLTFYCALSILEPVVVITIVNVVGIIVSNITSPIHRPYLWSYVISISLLFIYSVVPHWPNKVDSIRTLVALLLAQVAGYTLVKTAALSKRLYQVGFGAGDVMGVRFYLLTLVCVVKIICFPNSPWALSVQDVSIIILLGSLSIIFPVYILQVAYQYATTKQILLTLSFAPLFVFLLQFSITTNTPPWWITSSVMLVSLTSIVMASLQKTI